MGKWREIAEARGLGIPDEQIEKIAAPLDALEEAFRRVAEKIPHDVEPAVTFRCWPQDFQP